MTHNCNLLSSSFYYLMIALILVSAGVPGVVPVYAAPQEGMLSQGEMLTATLDESVQIEGFPATAAFIVHFNKQMNGDSSLSPLIVYPTVDGKTTWDSSFTTLTLRPELPLEAGNTYVFFLDPRLSSMSGETFSTSPQWTIKVAFGPRVLNSEISPNEKKATFTFDRSMNPESAEAFSIEPNLPFSSKWSSDKVLEVRFSEPFVRDVEYLLNIAGGSSEKAALARDGSVLDEDFYRSIWQEPLEFSVITLNPTMLLVQSNIDLDVEKTGIPFEISPELNGHWQEWKNAKEVIFKTEEPIPNGRKFTLKVTGKVYESSGEINLPVNQNSFLFMAPPPILKVEPENKKSSNGGFESLSVEISPIRIKFAIAVDKSSAEKAFRIYPEIKGYIKWSSSPGSTFEDTLTFYPSDLLEYDTTYKIELTTALTDISGNVLLIEPFTSSFFTNYYYEDYYYGLDGGTFGYGSKVQVVDANGPRRIQFTSNDKRNVTFELFKYDLYDFVRLYGNYRKGEGIAIPGESEKEQKPLASWIYTDINPDNPETAIPADVSPGLYILNMKYRGRNYDQLFIALSENTIVAKENGSELFVWVSDILGESVKDAEVRLYSDRGEKLREGHTDENGLYKVNLREGYTPMLVSARVYDEANNDISIVGLSGSWIEYSGQWERETISRKFLAYTYTDRPIYRPGQIVNFKTIVRVDDDVRYSLPPSAMSVTINLRDSKENQLETVKLKANSFGTVNGAFQLVEGCPLGSYVLEAVINGESHVQSFSVEEYRKPDFNISISQAQQGQTTRFVNGDNFDLSISAEYFFGEPVAGAKLSYKIYHLYPDYSWWWDESTSSDNVIYSWGWSDQNVQNPAKETDASGHAEITVTAMDDYYSDNYYYRSSLRSETFAVEVTADDGSNQTVSTAFIYTVYNSNEEITLDTGGYLKNSSKPFSVDVEAVTLEGQPVSDQSLLLEIKVWDKNEYDYSKVVEKYKVTTDSIGHAQQTLTLPSGFYLLELNGKDSRNNPISYGNYVYVLSSNGDEIDESGTSISIQADKDEYAPYQTARFAIESIMSGPALLTFERGSVLHSKMITLTAPLTLIDTPIITADAPNVFVTVNAWAPPASPDEEELSYFRESVPDSEIAMASTEIKVSAESNQLQIAISTDQATYGPGDNVTVNIDVKDSNGKPVIAEVSLAMVDEAIFSLSQEKAPNIFSAFYHPRGLGVRTYSSMGPKRILFYDGGGRGGGGGDGGVTKPRSDFQDTAAWFPALRTNGSGRVTASFVLPDNLTSWRLTAKAITFSHLVGETHSNIEVKKDLLIRPLLPRLLTTGDKVHLKAMVHNYAEVDRNLRVMLDAQGFQFTSPATQNVNVKAGGVQTVGWTIIPKSLGEKSFTFSASDGEQGDTVIIPIFVQPLAVRTVGSQTGQFNGALSLELPMPPDVIPEASTVTLQLSRSPASTVLTGLDYLVGYPYGCVEQQMSRTMPNAVLARAATRLGIGGQEFQAMIAPLIKSGTQKLYGYQHYDGGWGWWYDDYSDEYQTAWVLHGLALIQNAGYFVEPQVMEDGAEFLDENLADMDKRTRAYALFSMAMVGHGNLDETTTLTDSLRDLDPFGQAALAMALYELGQTSQARTTLFELEESAVVQGDLAWWPSLVEDGEYHNKTMASTIRTTAMVLDAFVNISKTHPLIIPASNYLIEQRTGYGWGTTNETSFTIIALTDSLMQMQKLNGSSNYSVEINGQVYDTGTLKPGNLFVRLDLPLADLQTGTNTIRISTTGSIPLFYDLVTSLNQNKSQVEKSGGIVVTRRYLDPETNKPLDTITEGQLIKVELVVRVAQPESYMIVEDHLPGGIEALNEGLSSTSHDVYSYEGDYYEEMFFWSDYGYNNKEIRDDRVSYFITDFHSGTQIFSYFARATVPGTFTALPAEAYAMYAPDTWGRSSSEVITILQK